MKILIDAQALQSNSKVRGIGRYSFELIKSILRKKSDHQIYILLNDLFSKDLENLITELQIYIDKKNIIVFRACGPVEEFKSEFRWNMHASELLREKFIKDLNPDVVLHTTLFEGSCDDTVVSIGRLESRVINATILYDLIPLTNVEKYLGWEEAKSWYFRRLEFLKRSDLLLSISESARQEAIELIHASPEKVKNIFAGVSEIFHQKDPGNDKQILKEKYGIEKKYLMHMGAFEERKNFETLIKAYGLLPARLQKEYALVLVFKITPESLQAIASALKDSKIDSRNVILTDFVDDENLARLYRKASLFVFPSLHEGFGLPPLEAMASGTPVIASNTTSLPEVVDLVEALFDPYSAEDVRDKIVKSLEDENFRSRLVQMGIKQSAKFTWDQAADRLLQALEIEFESSTTPRLNFDTLSLERGGEALSEFLDVLATVSSATRPTEEMIANAAIAIEANWNTALRLKACTAFQNSLNWRLEGPFDSTYSLAVVNRELARGLSELGHNIILHSTEGPGDFEPSKAFLKKNPDLSDMNARGKKIPSKASDVVSRLLYPPRVSDMADGPLNLLHCYAWEETGFPEEWVNSFNDSLDGVAMLSEHVEKILIDNGLNVPVAFGGCGVDHMEAIEADSSYKIKAKKFRFLHVSSCFPRKGVEELLDAYGMCFTKKDDVELVIKTFPNPHNEAYRWLAERRKSNPDYPKVQIIDEELTDSALKSLYEQCHVFVAPSRAEGFSVPLAEAMLAGLPVITTNWGGQLDFCTQDSAWLVDFDFARAESHFGVFASAWVRVKVPDLAANLLRAYASSEEERRSKVAVGRTILLENFKWSDVAARTVNAANIFQKYKLSDLRKPRIGWVTTWNTRCGIASYAKHLATNMTTPSFVFAPHTNELLCPDEEYVTRCWRSRNHENGFEYLSREIDKNKIDILIIQFNYGFFNFSDLNDFIQTQKTAGRIVLITLHATIDPPRNAANPLLISDLTVGLSACDRILVHGIRDMNNLKALGLVNNVALFPQGVVGGGEFRSNETDNQIAVIAAYGFCLPHKGLVELVHAISILLKRGVHVRLKLVNAEYPDPVSKNLIAELKSLISELGMRKNVSMNNAYLSDEESFDELKAADLIVFPYQNTNESSSAAVRYGMATGKPVAVTPLPIFEDLGNAVFKLGGVDADSIANGIAEIVHSLQTKSDISQSTSVAASNWVREHDYKRLGLRLERVGISLHNQKGRFRRTYNASSFALKHGEGIIRGKSVDTVENDGVLIFGPYLTLRPGDYRVRIYGKVKAKGQQGAHMDVVSDHGQTIHAVAAVEHSAEGICADVTFSIDNLVTNVEVRIFVHKSSNLSIDLIDLLEV